MGVTGGGKATVGTLLSARTGWKFEDAVDYHSGEKGRKMAAGIPLSDADRGAWLHALHERMLQYRQICQSAILACSALKQQYRSLLAGGFATKEMHFVYLHATTALIKERFKSRCHPYMNPVLLYSQLATLEVPTEAWPIDVARTPKESVEDVLARLREAGLLAGEAEKR